MKTSLLFSTMLMVSLFSCQNSEQPADGEALVENANDSIVTSFVFVGCNRMQWNDTLPSQSDASTANIDALKNIFTHVAASKQKTDYFFFLGDIVNGEATNAKLDSELKAWTQDYNNGVFSNFKASGITLIPVPGNHEMLTAKTKEHGEIPLAGTTDTWMKYMEKYMPKNRDKITGSSASVNQMTYGFTNGNVAFIVMNTDTYNTIDGTGVESHIPYDWVKKQVATYRKNPKIDHIFVMGHRPFYVGNPNDNGCKREYGHSGMGDSTQSDPVWQSFEDNEVASMLSAHVHQYQRMQPNSKTYQLIAGNGGSALNPPNPPKYFGYTRINVWASGRIEMISEGYNAPTPYYKAVPNPKWSIRDSLHDMNWYKKGAPVGGKCKCVKSN